MILLTWKGFVHTSSHLNFTTIQWFVGKTLSSLCRKGNKLRGVKWLLELHKCEFVRLQVTQLGLGLYLPSHGIHEISGPLDTQTSNNLCNNEKTSKQINKQKLSLSSTKSGVHSARGLAWAETHGTSQGRPVLWNPAQPLSWPTTIDLIGYIYVTGWKILQAPRGKVKDLVWTANQLANSDASPTIPSGQSKLWSTKHIASAWGSLWRVLKSESVSEVFISLIRMKTAQQKHLQASKQIILKFTKRGLSWEVRVKKTLKSECL